MNVLVCGGTGELGAYVVRRLVSAGHRCAVFARTERWNFLQDLVGRVRFIQGDATNPRSVDQVMEEGNYDAVCHLAADLVSDRSRPGAIFTANTVGTVNVLDAARRNDVGRVVYASSSIVYGGTSSDHGHPTYRPYRERDCPQPSSGHASLYGVAKLAGEHLCLAYYRQFGLQSFALRLAPSLCVGREVGHPALTVHRGMIEAAIESRPISVLSGGEERMDVVDGHDVARAFELACTAPYRPDASILNVSSGRGRTLGEWARAIQEVVGTAEIDIGPGLDFLHLPGNYRVLDPGLAGSVLGFRPTNELKSIVEGYMEVRDLLRNRNESKGKARRGS